jgi:soluble lytic murein transglycosylase-like protein
MLPAILAALLAFAFVASRFRAAAPAGAGEVQPALPAEPPPAIGVYLPPVATWTPGAGQVSPSELLPIIMAEADGWHDPRDVLATIAVESSFRPNAYRFERHLGEASWGLMQTLESTARDMGYSGPAEGLYDPAESIRYGMRYMRWLWDFLTTRLGAEPSYAQWIGAYNAGPGNVLRGRVPYGYVLKWERARAAIA